MSYDDWKTDPDYEEGRLRRYMRMEREDAIKAGYGGYDRPAEAKMCAELGLKYCGRYNKKHFEGIPERDYPEGDY